MTPDSQVWISTARNGIAYHTIAPEGRRTLCGRYIGHAIVIYGHVLALADVVDRFGSKPCRHCAGDTERVQPKIETRWWGRGG